MKSPGRLALPLFVGTLLALLSLFAASVALAAPVAAPGSTSLVISEVYAPVQTAGNPEAQWFEIYNPTGYTYPLNGLQVANKSVRTPLTGQVVLGPQQFALVGASQIGLLKALGGSANGARIIEAPELFPLDSQSDAVLLTTPDGAIVIDQVNWGIPDANWPNYNSQLWNPGLSALDNVDGKARSWGRTPPGKDSGNSGDWSIHDTLSPGDTVRAVDDPPFFLGVFSDAVGALGGLLLWLGFVVVGVIAYRFEETREIRTYWQLLALAPSGLILWTLLRSAQPDGQPPLWVILVLVLTALLCLVGMSVFRNVARILLEGK